MKGRAIDFEERAYATTAGEERAWLRWAAPVGRTLFALLFLISGARHFLSGTIAYAESQGVPAAGVLVPLSGAIALAGAVSIVIGFHARIGAALLLVFLIPVTLMMHQFWAIEDPMEAAVQQATFIKNVALMGAAVMLLYWGAGPVSVDSVRTRTRNHPVPPADNPPPSPS